MVSRLAIIPVSMDSKRLPGKPLMMIDGKTIIQRVYEQVDGLFDRTIIVTADDEVIDHVISFAEVFVATEAHINGSEACAEVARFFPGFDIIINVQGDKPFVSRQALDMLKSWNGNTEMATLVYPILDIDQDNQNRVKVILIGDQAVDYSRDRRITEWQSGGVYAYTRAFLQTYSKLSQTTRERELHLEQLRTLDNKYQITAFKIDEKLISIDCQADLDNAQKKIQK